jgi:putative addiction module component (TIGR02574 family)
MTDKAKALLAQALELEESERAEIAGSLLQSLEPPPSTDVDAAWRVEVRRRLAELDSGEAETIPWETVRDELLAKLSGAAR